MDAIRSMNQLGTAALKSSAPIKSSEQPSEASPRTTLKGSCSREMQNCQYVGENRPNEQFKVSIVLNKCEGAQTSSIQNFAKQYGLNVSDINAKTRTVSLSGTGAQYEKAFGVKLGRYRDNDGNEFRGHKGEISLPKDLAGSVTGVLGLNNRPFARPHNSGLKPKDDSSSGFNPADVGKAYNFPANTDGTGQTVAIIELGGGYNDADLQAYWQKYGITPPKVSSVGVDGASNAPVNDPNSADGEVALDVEVVGAVAPGANIKVYFAPNTDQGFVDAVNAAVNDSAGKPAAVSVSWGAPESSWSPQAMASFDAALKSAADSGVNVFVASGDSGSTDGADDGSDHVDYPASSQWSVGAGGTTLNVANGQISGETVWNDGAFGGAAGGGWSAVEAMPAWQKAAGLQAPSTAAGGRGVPDISGDADPATGYDVIVDGQDGTIGGTSAVAPLLSALTARLAQGLGQPVGFLPPQIYGDSFKNAFNDITQGNNGTFSAGPGWDAASGLGSPDGTKLLAALKAAQAPPAPAPAPPAPAPPSGSLAHANEFILAR